MKKLLFSAMAMAAMVTPVQAEEVKQPYAKLKKQINIMSNIIESSIGEGNDRRSRSGIKVTGLYLKSQGVVFQIDNPHSMKQFFRKFGEGLSLELGVHSIPDIPAIAPVVIGDGDDIIITSDFDHDAYEDVIEAFREQSEYARDMREQQRELAYEIRSVQRRKRDLEFELRHARADEEDKKDANKEMAEIDRELAKLEQQQQEISQRAEKEEVELKKKKSERKAKVAKARNSYFKTLDQTIVDTLCSYGAGLRKLAKNEYVTFVIDMGATSNSKNNKKIHTFTKKDIVACVLEDKSPEQLMKSAQSYYF